jgi:hypothetical protein
VRTRIGPSWLIVLTLGYGILEIAWVLYLLFFQDRSGTAHHAHLAAAGLASGGSALAVLTAALVLRSRPWALVAAVMTATWLAATLFLALVLTHVAVIYASLPGILAAVVITHSLLLERWPHRVWAWLLVAVAALLLVHLGFVLTSTGTTFHADRLRLLIVLYDSAEVAALLGLGSPCGRGRHGPRSCSVQAASCCSCSTPG